MNTKTQNFNNLIESINVMKFKEGIYYTIILLIVITFLIVFLTKPELFINKWIVTLVFGIMGLILRQLFKLIKKDEHKK